MTKKDALMLEIENLVEYGAQLQEEIDQADLDADTSSLEQEEAEVSKRLNELQDKLERGEY